MGNDLGHIATVVSKTIDGNSHQTLREALEMMAGDPPSSIPWLVRLLENPASPIALPGKINLFCHDCLHLLLGKSMSLEDEAFVVGFTMGNDTKTKQLHLVLFKVCSCWFYPKAYRFHREHLKTFDAGVAAGRSARFKNLNQVTFACYENYTIGALRDLFEIPVNDPSGCQV